MFKTFTLIGAAVASVAVLGAALPASAAPPAPAQIPVLCPVLGTPPPVDDNVRIVLPQNFDFGDGELNSSSEPSGCGTLTWDLANGTITPRLEGTLFAKNAIGTEVRMRLRYRDVDGTLLETQPGGTKEVTSNDVTEFTIDLGDYSDPLIYRVDVELQQKLGGVWQTLGTEREYIGSQSKSPDNVLNTAVGQDFGTGPFSGGQPSAPGTLTWDLANDTITPRLAGDLIMVNSQGTRARMRITSYDVHGNELSRFASGTKEPSSNAVARFPINVGAGRGRPGDLPGGRRDHRRRLRDVDAGRQRRHRVHLILPIPPQEPAGVRRRRSTRAGAVGAGRGVSAGAPRRAPAPRPAQRGGRRSAPGRRPAGRRRPPARGSGGRRDRPGRAPTGGVRRQHRRPQ